MLVQLENVTFGYGAPIVHGVSFSVHEGERIGFVGGNGEGKTTILKLILGELTPDTGTVVRKNNLCIGYLPQTGGFESEDTVYSAMKEVFREDEKLLADLRAAQAAYSTASGGDVAILSAKIESLEKRIAARDSYNYEVRIRTVLGGMGFGGRTEQIVSTMSGGEKTRLKLCRLLLEAPELLILDEPTNHLDLPALFWLEDYLASYKGALLIASHDRYFLDRLTARTLELERGRLSSFKGNYSVYKGLKAMRYEEELRAYKRQQEEIAKLKEYVDRNIVRATTAKSALSRVNKLERMEIVDRPTPPPPPPRFQFTFEENPYERVIACHGFDLFAEEKQLLTRTDFNLMRGEKCALVGENGTGKSTLLKFLLSGDRCVEIGKYVKIAYYDQENADFDPNEGTLEAYWGRFPRLSQTEARATLAAAGLYAEDIEKKVGALSGGQRAKLALAVLETAHANVLLLDEPTNHLDLPAREALEDALRAFEGTILFVSHDRRFIEGIATKICAIEEKKLVFFAGGYAQYLAEKKRTEKKPPVQPKEKGEGYRSAKERAAEANRRKRQKEIEAELEALEKREEELNSAMLEQAADYRKVQAIAAELEALRKTADALYEEYGTLL